MIFRQLWRAFERCSNGPTLNHFLLKVVRVYESRPCQKAQKVRPRLRKCCIILLHFIVLSSKFPSEKGENLQNYFRLSNLRSLHVVLGLIELKHIFGQPKVWPEKDRVVGLDNLFPLLSCPLSFGLLTSYAKTFLVVHGARQTVPDLKKEPSVVWRAAPTDSCHAPSRRTRTRKSYNSHN